MNAKKRKGLVELFKKFLIGHGIELKDGLELTPTRFQKAFEYLLSGYKQSPKKILGTRFKSVYDGAVIVKNIPFHSLCEHHLLPIKGHVSVGYIPDKEVVGLSKIPRLVECYARRLITQEDFTDEIAKTLFIYLETKGVAVHVESDHFCMSMRGVQKDASMVTTTLMGVYKNNHIARDEFFKSINRRR